MKIYIKETGKITGAKESLPLFAKHSLEGPCGTTLSEGSVKPGVLELRGQGLDRRLAVKCKEEGRRFEA